MTKKDEKIFFLAKEKQKHHNDNDDNVVKYGKFIVLINHLDIKRGDGKNTIHFDIYCMNNVES